MRELDELLETVITVDDGLRIIANLETANRPSKKTSKKNTDSEYSLEILSEFKSAFYKMPVVELTVGISPTRDLLSKIRDWFWENSGKKVVLKLRVEPEVIGGVKIVFNDHYKDLSIGTKLVDFFKKESGGETENIKVLPSTLI